MRPGHPRSSNEPVGGKECAQAICAVPLSSAEPEELDGILWRQPLAITLASMASWSRARVGGPEPGSCSDLSKSEALIGSTGRLNRTESSGRVPGFPS